MASLNKVHIIGNLGADPEVRTFQNGGKVCNFTVACSESWKDKQTGEKREKTEWVKVSVFSDGLASTCEKYLRKGSKVYVEGKLQTRKWQDQSGQDRYTTEVVIQGYGGEVKFLDGKGGVANANSAYSGGGGHVHNGGGADLDDEIPF